MKRSFFEKLQQNPIIVAWFGIWGVVAALNFSAGCEVGGKPIGVAFVCMAVLGAYASLTYDSAEGSRRVGLVILMLAQLGLGQWAGWQTLGINLSKGAGGLESSAGSHNSASDALRKARDERDALGTPRTIGAIEAEETYECQSGVGPKCTRLRSELENAKRATELDTRIPELVKELGDGSQLTDPEAPYNVAKAFMSAVKSVLLGSKQEATRDDAIFWFSIFFTLLLEFVGTCGPWLFQFAEKWADPEPPKPKHLVDEWDFGPKQITFAGAQGNALSSPHDPRTVAGPMDHGDHSARAASGGSPRGSLGSPSAGGDGLHQPPQTSASVPANQHQHGAPITVNLYGAQGAASAAAPNAGATTAEGLHTVTDQNVAALRAVSRRPVTPEMEETVREAPHFPVDRTTLNERLDSLLVFLAKELVAQTGALTDAEQIYGRYHAWAQERAMSAAAFHTLFPVATGFELKELGGVKHYEGVALRRISLVKEAS